MYTIFVAQLTYVAFLSAAVEISIYVIFKRLFLTKLTHLCTQFQKLDPPMNAYLSFQIHPYWIIYFIGVSPWGCIGLVNLYCWLKFNFSFWLFAFLHCFL